MIAQPFFHCSIIPHIAFGIFGFGMVPWILIAFEFKRSCWPFKKCYQNYFRLKWDLWHWMKDSVLHTLRTSHEKSDVFEPTVRVVLSHYWTDAVEVAAVVSPAARRWRETQSRGRSRGWIPQPRRRKTVWAWAGPLVLRLVSPLRDPARLTKSHCWARAWDQECCTWEDKDRQCAWRPWCIRGGKWVRGRQTQGACWEGCCCNHGFPLQIKHKIIK